MPPIRRHPLLDVKTTRRALVAAREEYDVSSLAKKTAGVVFQTPKIDLSQIVFRTHLEAQIRAFPPMEKTQTRDRIRRNQTCESCKQPLAADFWSLLHTCQETKCTILCPIVPPCKEASLMHTCHKLFCATRVQCDPMCHIVVCTRCETRVLSEHYLQDTVFQLYRIRQRVSKVPLPCGNMLLQQRMHLWNLYTTSTYVQDWVKATGKGEVYVLDNLWARWSCRRPCAACDQEILTTAFRLAENLTVVCEACSLVQRTTCFVCKARKAVVTGYERRSSGGYFHQPMCCPCFMNRKIITCPAPVQLCAPTFLGSAYDEALIEREIKRLLQSDHARGMQGALTLAEVVARLEFQKNTCALCQRAVTWPVLNTCKKQPSDFSINRISNKNPHRSDNIVITCWGCNMAYRTCVDCGVASMDRGLFFILDQKTLCFACSKTRIENNHGEDDQQEA